MRFPRPRKKYNSSEKLQRIRQEAPPAPQLALSDDCAKKIWTFRKRGTIPPSWRDISAEILNAGLPEGLPQNVSAQRDYFWRLVLSAKGIPHRGIPGARPKLFVPQEIALDALHEICAFEREKPMPPLPPPPGNAASFLVLLLFAPLALWHALRWGEIRVSFLPEDPSAWLPLAGLDAYKTSALGQVWRCITALTLHADAGHLAGNVALGFIFCVPLFRRTGIGVGSLLVLLAGACGNLFTAMLRPARAMSQGFSTAVFAAIGLLAAIIAMETYMHARKVTSHTQGAHISPIWLALRHAFLPLGAGLGFLALLGGSDAPNADYLAHTLGLCCGLCLGSAVAYPAFQMFTLPAWQQRILQAGALCTASGLAIYAWLLALRIG